MHVLKTFYRSPWIWGTHLLGAAIALLAPADVLSESPALREFVSTMGNLFPIVKGYQTKSSLPEVSGLYFASMMIAGPIWLWQSLTKLSHTLLNDRARIWTLPRWLQLLIVFAGTGPFCLGLFIGMLFINDGGHDFHAFPINSSRIALAVWGPLFALAPWGFPAVFVASMKRVRTAN